RQEFTESATQGAYWGRRGGGEGAASTTAPLLHCFSPLPKCICGGSRLQTGGLGSTLPEGTNPLRRSVGSQGSARSFRPTAGRRGDLGRVTGEANGMKLVIERSELLRALAHVTS